MTRMATDFRQLLQQGRAQAGGRDPQPPWLAALRERAGAEAAAMDLPGRRDEDWRYTPTAFLEQEAYRSPPGGPVDAIQRTDVEDLFLDASETLRLVFVNGCLAPDLCSPLGTQAGVLVTNLAGTLGTVPEDLQVQLDGIADHRHLFAALNTALMSDGAVIRCSAATESRTPIEILHVSVGMEEPAILHPRHLVVLEPGARATLIERYCALGEGRYFNNALIEIALGEGSELSHQRVQEESGEAQHLSDLHIVQQARSSYRLAQASLGAAWSRSDLRLVFRGEHARAELDGLLLAGDRQLNDLHLDIRHEVPNCSSRESFKGILDGRGRLVFDGRILVARDAQKTDARLSNDNLMLSRAAEVDTKPQLEIYADDVKCSHGTTVGELDADMLFYLRARGIDEQTATRMLCQGFAQQAIDAFVGDALRQRVARRLAGRLGRAQ